MLSLQTIVAVVPVCIQFLSLRLSFTDYSCNQRFGYEYGLQTHIMYFENECLILIIESHIPSQERSEKLAM
jgi:hypothetical protein